MTYHVCYWFARCHNFGQGHKEGNEVREDGGEPYHKVIINLLESFPDADVEELKDDYRRYSKGTRVEKEAFHKPAKVAKSVRKGANPESENVEATNDGGVSSTLQLCRTQSLVTLTLALN